MYAPTPNYMTHGLDRWKINFQKVKQKLFMKHLHLFENEYSKMHKVGPVHVRSICGYLWAILNIPKGCIDSISPFSIHIFFLLLKVKMIVFSFIFKGQDAGRSTWGVHTGKQMHHCSFCSFFKIKDEEDFMPLIFNILH